MRLHSCALVVVLKRNGAVRTRPKNSPNRYGAPCARLVEAFTAFLATLLECLRVRYAGAGDRGARSVSRAISGGMPSRIGYP